MDNVFVYEFLNPVSLVTCSGSSSSARSSDYQLDLSDGQKIEFSFLGQLGLGFSDWLDTNVFNHQLIKIKYKLDEASSLAYFKVFYPGGGDCTYSTFTTPDIYQTLATFITSDNDEWHIKKDTDGNLWLTGNDIDWKCYKIVKDNQSVTGYTLENNDIILSVTEQKWITLVAEEHLSIL